MTAGGMQLKLMVCRITSGCKVSVVVVNVNRFVYVILNRLFNLQFCRFI